MDRGNCSSFDIENPCYSLAKSMKTELECLSRLSSECSIYRVPERLRRAKEKDYTPQVVSIGPLHHGRESLKAMEEHKMRYLKDFIERSQECLEFYIKVVKEEEVRLRSCYAETIPFRCDEFVKIVVVDTAFIIEVLLRSYFPELQDRDDRIFYKQRMIQDVWSDMQLLENQLPFFILADLFKLSKVTIPYQLGKRPSIVELSYNFFKERMLLAVTKDNLMKFNSDKFEHFVDLLRKLYLPSQARKERKLQTLTMPCMTELHQAGVRFEVGSSRNVFDIEFVKGILKIPKLIICGETELSIRNMVAFEQCHCDKNYMNDYVVIMDRLVNTHKDVDLLVEYGIVENRLGDSNEGAILINKLADGVVVEFEEFYFAGLSEDLNTYCRRPWHRWKANLKQNYFNTPWAIISVIAGFILIILTLIQSVCSVISVVFDKQN
ncbi:UPF0481 protein At3g47200-like [Juglans microcarpa x Juglans regia]|uniref:UPF0481 protein At3g47200-like n=1 Tax=Juglans microcarpa x Juglans regia TaxID=2249226 RepID=UPI001B7DDB68|nr:UPF0481 protein At3g47200-like [Juglans microcarpa x Juglans regia]XP_041019580.1 UPF0481 protein At3g47200-like [Juglans microcarpa x Juglans regia]